MGLASKERVSKYELDVREERKKQERERQVRTKKTKKS